jgi:hypothetical protein
MIKTKKDQRRGLKMQKKGEKNNNEDLQKIYKKKEYSFSQPVKP